jgi:hypothetical protein
MRRSILITSTGLALLAVALLPAAASAEHHGRRHHHHHRGAHARLKRFGTDNPSAPVTDNAGTVTSLVEGTLTIKLTDGSSVTGKVTSTTELKCEVAGSVRMADHGDRGEEGPGENHDSAGQGGPGPSDESPAAGDDGNHDEGQACDMTALTQGAVVRDAELRISSPGATFAEVEIVR